MAVSVYENFRGVIYARPGHDGTIELSGPMEKVST